MKASPRETAGPRSTAPGILGLGALVVCATILAYLPSLSGEFIWNDSDYVTATALRSLRGLARIWTDVGATQQYYPLLHSAFWLQHRLWGDNPLGYHVVTVLLHAGSAVLFALVLRRLLDGCGSPGRFAGAEWLAALLFALHPAHVESVAWITEQKNTLSLVFYLGAALLYLRFDESRRPGAYAAALALFVLSLLCKTVTATLPAALLVVFWWMRGRLGWKRDALPLLPWLALGVAGGLFSSWVERNFVGARGAEFALPAVARLLVAGRAVWFYAGKVVWPFGVNFLYTRWTVDAAVWWQWLYPLGVLAVAAALWAVRRRTRGPLAAFLFFVGSLFPVLGFVNLFGARYSWVWDHWQYLPDLGLLALAGVGLSEGWRLAPPLLRIPAGGLAAALFALLGALTWSHCRMFHDDQTLYTSTIERNPDAWLAHNNLGVELGKMPGRLADAVAQYKETLRLNPDFAEAHYNMGKALARMPGKLGEAVAEYEEALRLRPFYAEAHNNLGNAWSQMPGRLADAAAEYEEALRLKPDYVEAHYNLGNIWLGMPGKLADAVAEYEEALRLKPDLVEAHYNLGNALSQMPGRLNDAVAQYRETLRLKPEFAPGWHNLGTILFSQGNLPAAAEAFREELRLSPNDPSARQALAAALQQARAQ